MLNQLPSWAKFLIGFAATMLAGYMTAQMANDRTYLFMGIAAGVGIFLFWKGERSFAYGVFAALVIAVAVLAMAIFAFARQ